MLGPFPSHAQCRFTLGGGAVDEGTMKVRWRFVDLAVPEHWEVDRVLHCRWTGGFHLNAWSQAAERKVRANIAADDAIVEFIASDPMLAGVMRFTPSPGLVMAKVRPYAPGSLAMVCLVHESQTVVLLVTALPSADIGTLLTRVEEKVACLRERRGWADEQLWKDPRWGDSNRVQSLSMHQSGMNLDWKSDLSDRDRIQALSMFQGDQFESDLDNRAATRHLAAEQSELSVAALVSALVVPGSWSPQFAHADPDSEDWADILRWCTATLPTQADAAPWVRAGVDPLNAIDWTRNGFTHDQIGPWEHQFTGDAFTARRWATAGVSPQAAAQWATVVAKRLRGLPKPPVPEWAGTTAQIAAATAGLSPDQYLAFDDCTPTEFKRLFEPSSPTDPCLKFEDCTPAQAHHWLDEDEYVHAHADNRAVFTQEAPPSPPSPPHTPPMSQGPQNGPREFLSSVQPPSDQIEQAIQSLLMGTGLWTQQVYRSQVKRFLTWARANASENWLSDDFLPSAYRTYLLSSGVSAGAAQNATGLADRFISALRRNQDEVTREPYSVDPRIHASQTHTSLTHTKTDTTKSHANQTDDTKARAKQPSPMLSVQSTLDPIEQAIQILVIDTGLKTRQIYRSQVNRFLAWSHMNGHEDWLSNASLLSTYQVHLQSSGVSENAARNAARLAERFTEAFRRIDRRVIDEPYSSNPLYRWAQAHSSRMHTELDNTKPELNQGDDTKMPAQPALASTADAYRARASIDMGVEDMIFAALGLPTATETEPPTTFPSPHPEQ
jgi:hypothetical protein